MSACIAESGLIRSQLESTLRHVRGQGGGSSGGGEGGAGGRDDGRKTVDTQSGDENFEALLKYVLL